MYYKAYPTQKVKDTYLPLRTGDWYWITKETTNPDVCITLGYCLNGEFFPSQCFALASKYHIFIERTEPISEEEVILLML